MCGVVVLCATRKEQIVATRRHQRRARETARLDLWSFLFSKRARARTAGEWWGNTRTAREKRGAVLSASAFFRACFTAQEDLRQRRFDTQARGELEFHGTRFEIKLAENSSASLGAYLRISQRQKSSRGMLALKFYTECSRDESRDVRTIERARTRARARSRRLSGTLIDRTHMGKRKRDLRYFVV